MPKIDRPGAESSRLSVDAAGEPGGELRMLMASPKDTRMMVVYGYARLVGYTPALEIAADILKSIDVEDGRIFTLHLRQGMKWSDGQPFTAEDFRYWFEDVAKNPKLSPSGLPVDAAAERPAAALRGPRRHDGPLQLVAAEPAVSARLWPGRTRCSSIARRII